MGRTTSRSLAVLPRAAINVTPMIDVILVLLIITMILTPVINSGVVLPQGTHLDSLPQQPGEVILMIDRNGVYLLSATGGAVPGESPPRAIAVRALGNQLESLFAERANDRILYLKADYRLAFGPIQEAIGVARRAGVRVIAAVAETRAPRPPRTEFPHTPRAGSP